MTKELETTVKETIEPLGYELVDFEYRKEGCRWVVRLFIDKQGGITVDDCQAVSQRVSFELDAKSALNESYTLEVSSPGLNRKLKKIADFQKFLNSPVTVKTFEPIQNQKHFCGRLVSVDEEMIRVEEAPGMPKEIPHKNIALARIKYT